MKHSIPEETAKAIAEKLHAIGTLYAAILIELDDAPIDIRVEEFRHRLQPDGLLEYEAYLSDDTTIRIELVHAK